MGPDRRISHVHVIEMGVEHQRRSLAATRYLAQDIAHLVDLDFGVAELAHLRGHELGDRGLFSGQAGGSDQALEKVQGGVEIVHGASLARLATRP